MTTEYLSSEEMIRRAKETLRLAKEDVIPQVDRTLAEKGMQIGAVVLPMEGDIAEEMPSRAMAERMNTVDAVRSPSRVRRVQQMTPDHLIVQPRSARMPSVPVAASPVSAGTTTSDGRGMRIIGTLLIGLVLFFWLALLGSIIDDPSDVGGTLTGGGIITVIPLVFGVLLRRAGKRKGTPV